MGKGWVAFLAIILASCATTPKLKQVSPSEIGLSSDTILKLETESWKQSKEYQKVGDPKPSPSVVEQWRYPDSPPTAIDQVNCKIVSKDEKVYYCAYRVSYGSTTESQSWHFKQDTNGDWEQFLIVRSH